MKLYSLSFINPQNPTAWNSYARLIGYGLLGSIFFSMHISNAFTRLTILTQPPGGSTEWSGHAQVNQSLIRGLNAHNISFNVNPSIEDIGDVVIVPANIAALRYAISLKDARVIKYLLAGPNLVVRSNEHNHLITHPAIDRCIVPSQWVKIAYEEETPALIGRVVIWPAGVDPQVWYPSPTALESSTVLVYKKHTVSEQLVTAVEVALSLHGWKPHRIAYGSYTHKQFLHHLHSVRFAVFLSRTESQGIALAESWACDIPTLVWDPQEPTQISGRMYWPVMSAPYLTTQTGVCWRTIAELNTILDNIEEHLASAHPRAWVLDHMTDLASIQILLTIINDLENSVRNNNLIEIPQHQ